ncbi:MAG: DUF2029 domain-containing protein [Planctomycetes bacterium]|nr:DUF2029 domain-containing protein [Planctomycetota bacterium]
MEAPAAKLDVDWLTRNRAMKLGALAAGLVVLVALAVLIQPYWRQSPTDFIVYWEAGERMRAGGADLYAQAADPMNQVGRYIYPPAFAALFAPLTWLPREAGFGVWAALQLVIACAAFWLLRGLCGVRRKGELIDWAFAGLVAIFGPLVVNIIEGQINMLVIGLIAAGLWLVESRRPLRGGLLIALAVHIKILPVVLLAVLVVQRRFRAALGVGIGLALFYFLPLVWTAPALGVGDGVARNHAMIATYATELVAPNVGSKAAPELGGSRAPNNSLAAVSLRYFGEESHLHSLVETRGPLAFTVDGSILRWLGPGLGGLMFVAALGLAWRRREDRLSRAACAGLAFAAASLGHLLCWFHHLVAALLLIAPLAAMVARDGRHKRVLAVALIAMVGLAHAALVDQSYWMLILGTPTLAMLIVWGLTAWVVVRRPRDAAGPREMER